MIWYLQTPPMPYPKTPVFQLSNQFLKINGLRKDFQFLNTHRKSHITIIRFGQIQERMGVAVLVFLKTNKKSRPISRILSGLIIYLGRTLLNASIRLPFCVGRATQKYRFTWRFTVQSLPISLQPNCTCFLLHWSAFRRKDGRYPLYCSMVSGLSSLRPKDEQR